MYCKIFSMSAIKNVVFFIICVFIYDHDANSSIKSIITPVEEVYDIIKEKYFYEDQSDMKITEGAINGMMHSLDPYSSFFSESDFLEFQNNTNGNFGGIGLEMTQNKKDNITYINVMSVFPNTPAARAGMMSGDILISVDNQNIAGMNLAQVSKKVRGLVGTKVNLSIFRPLENKNYNLSLTREEIKIKSVHLKYQHHIPIVEVRMFANSTYNDFLGAIKNINANNLPAIVIDVRNNPGGLLDSAVRICDLFLPVNANITTVIAKNNNVIANYVATRKPHVTLNNIPIYVLINKGSASASEVLAACLQENNVAKLVGEKTFGKASVQEMIKLESLEGAAIKLTVAKYLTPSGKMIHGVGIEPDIYIKDVRSKNKDNILDYVINQVRNNNNANSYHLDDE
jgi:carboxyl-terminal processing protease